MLPFQKMLSYTILQEKHHDLKTENGKIWKIRKVRAIPIVTGALGGVTKSLEVGRQIWHSDESTVNAKDCSMRNNNIVKEDTRT